MGPEPRTGPIPATAGALERASFFPRVYGWMALGLLVSAVASFALLSSPSALKFVFGVVGASQALVADAVHSLSDSATDVAILIGAPYWSALHAPVSTFW